MGSDYQLHIFFFPFMAHGHSIPIIDMARLFAARGTKSTIITTPLNAYFFSDTLDRDRQKGLDISLQVIQFPSAQVGLPEGCESVESITTIDMLVNFFEATTKLQQPFEQLLKKHQPDCIISDMFFHWTTELASKHGIARLVFHGMSYFPLSLFENIKRYAPYENIASDSDVFVVPGLPDQIEMTKAQLPDHIVARNAISDMMEVINETELKSFGIVVNTFYELEPAYAEYYKNEMGRRAWNIGPVSLYNINIVDKATRGQKSSIDEHCCLQWLDDKKPNSVLYVCYGSCSRFSSNQLLEIAMGLEASEIPFIWVIKTPRNNEKEQFLPTGFEQRMKGTGLLIRDWAPQVLILDHPAIGGFMTHCGWNSTLEGVSAGVTFITWPVFADQFNNEKFITQVLKIGISAGNEVWNSWVEPENVMVKREMIEKVVTQLMSHGEEADEMRNRAKELGEIAKRTVEEGGSSYTNLTDLIEKLREHKSIHTSQRSKEKAINK
ncbi:hypothetical protein IFM89_005811 [Coptis chinensis]|uniref:Uncharacterized protein n=1 Tax=Coptis chinensis TaxID=261450 RepID=A0A835IMJ2_9MAGN|nr:hypothetical protein IFM89_005811 [Coptis chinensis]